MKGDVIGFDSNANVGAISGYDGRRYDFATMDWHGNRRAQRGDVADFAADGQRATQIYLVEEAYVAPSIRTFLFSASGRISLPQFWLKWNLPLILVFTVLIFLSPIYSIATGVFKILGLFSIFPGIAIYIKRAHDRDRSGWFNLLFFVPLLSLWPFVELSFLPGTIGSNRFGPDPVEKTPVQARVIPAVISPTGATVARTPALGSIGAEAKIPMGVALFVLAAAAVVALFVVFR
jgi:uncharacterized membrane protein YhaH (DUF805 family)